jgi:hypothetical protein
LASTVEWGKGATTMSLNAAWKSASVSAALAACVASAAPASFSEGSMPSAIKAAGAADCASARRSSRCVKFEDKAPTRMIETLKGATIQRVKLPANARREASGGVFI